MRDIYVRSMWNPTYLGTSKETETAAKRRLVWVAIHRMPSPCNFKSKSGGNVEEKVVKNNHIRNWEVIAIRIFPCLHDTFMWHWLHTAHLVISQGLFQAVLVSYMEMLGQCDWHSDPTSRKDKLENHTAMSYDCHSCVLRHEIIYSYQSMDKRAFTHVFV